MLVDKGGGRGKGEGKRKEKTEETGMGQGKRRNRRGKGKKGEIGRRNKTRILIKMMQLHDGYYYCTTYFE